MEKYITKNGIKYELRGEQYYPMLEISEQTNYMEMKTLNPVILRELIEKIEVYQIEGTGKNRTQRVVIHYRFVGCLQIPEWHRKRKVTLESRQGVAVNYLPTTA